MLSVASTTGCSCLTGPAIETNETDETSKDAGADAADASEALPCGVDCAGFDTPPCKVAVCNTGQELGPLNTCVVVAAPKGIGCDDGEFCTTNDACDNGSCVGGPTNDCGLALAPCEAILCNEESKACSITPVNDGTACTPTNLCKVDGVCQTGECMGVTKDCGFSPLNECNHVECDAATGVCTGKPDPLKDGTTCVLTGDLCKVDKACVTGLCVGGTDKDCSGFDVECEVGVCDPATGICNPVLGPIGATCSDGIDQCEVGLCNPNGECEPKAAVDGVACNDHDACTAADECAAGVCTNGAPVAGCTHWFQDSFDVCPNGWSFAGDWECGAPQNVGPSSPHTGTGVIATKLAGLYSVNQGFNTAAATSPAIDLTLATNPMVSFWAWDHTEGGTFDGWNLKVSTNGGMNFTEVTTVTPPYPLTILSQPAWGGDHSGEDWKNYTADLTAYAGQSILLRFAFRSDGATVYPGVYIDDFLVDEPLHIPLYITTSSPLTDVYAGVDVSVPLARIGGTTGAAWSIVPGGMNDSWLTIDPATGVLGGTPTVADVGYVSVTVRVEEPTLPSNFDEKTFNFNVIYTAYYTSFEGACPAGWTLTGDWECGVPATEGPMTAYVGTQCIATQIDAKYSNNQTFAGATATSPDIDLTASPFPLLTFRMWIETEGFTFDGVNLNVTTDGANYSVLNSVTPAYPLTVAGEPAWGGQQGAQGWQLMQADLSAYAGQIIRLRFAFRSNSSGTFPGIYIDDFFVN